MQLIAMFSIKDLASNLFLEPFPAVNPMVAIRNFRIACMDETTIFSKAPSDFGLYEVGIFDKETGLIDAHEDPIEVISGVNVIKEPLGNGESKRNAASVLSGPEGGNSEKHV